jgi:hypothetical protein
MDWSEILTESEGRYMQDVLVKLRKVSWAAPLLTAIESQGGITHDNKPLLFEARVANVLAKLCLADVEYEFPTNVNGSKVDFRLGTHPRWLVEVVSIGRSKHKEAATVSDGVMFGTVLSSPRICDTYDERKRSEEHESLLVVQKIGEKLQDKKGPIKFPVIVPDQYHAIIVDMRGHLGGGDIEDWKQIAYGTETVAPEFRKAWLTNDDKVVPFMGVWHPRNSMRFAATARDRLHAIIFVAEEHYSDNAFLDNAWVAGNPHLFSDEAAAAAAISTLPLWSEYKRKR